MAGEVSIGDVVAVLRIRDEMTQVFRNVGRESEQAMGVVASAFESASVSEASFSSALHKVMGAEIIEKANAYAAALQHVGGVSALTNDEQKQINATVTEAIAKYEALGAEAPDDLKQIAEATKQVEEKTSGWQTALGAMKGVIGGLAIGKLAKDFFDTAGHLTDISAQTGISVRELQRLKFTGDQVGVSLDTVATGALQLQKRLASDEDGVQAALVKVGIEFNKIREMDPGAQMEAIAAGIAKIPNQSERVRVAWELLGRGGGQLLPLLTSDLKKMGDEAERVGAVMSDDVVAAGDNAGDSWSRLKNVGGSLIGSVLSPILPILEKIAPFAESAASGMTKLEGAMTKFLTHPIQYFKDGIEQTGKEWDKFVNKQIPPETPKSLREIAKSLQDGLPPLSMTVEEMNRLSDELDRQRDKQNEAAKAASAHAEEIKKMRDILSGEGAIKAARDLQEALRGTVPVQNMTKDAQAQINKVVTEAMDAYKALGRTAPGELNKLWLATVPGVEVSAGLGAFAKNGVLQIGKTIEVEGAPIMGRSLAGVVQQIPGIAEQEFTHIQDPVTKQLITFWHGVAVNGTQGGLLTGLSETIRTELGPTIMSAITGGGDIGKSVGGLIGGKIGQNISDMSAKTLTSLFGKTFGGALDSILPGVGTLIGSFAGKLADKLFGGLFGTAGRDKVEDFVKSTFGTFDAMHEQLNRLNVDGSQAGEELWRAISQGVGRNNPKEAEAAIKRVQDALAHIPPTMADVAAQAGFQTTEQLNKAAADAVKLWQFMKDSGQYSADQVQQAWQHAQEALAKTGDAQVVSIQTSLDAAKGALSLLDSEIASLQASIANEAPEEVMGVVEAQARARLDALQKEREAATKHVEELQDQLRESMEHVATALEQLPREIAIRVNADVVTHGGGGHGGDGSTPGFRAGSMGVRDFGGGTMAILHGREEVVREGAPSSADMTGLEDKLDSIHQGILGLPDDLSRAFRDSMLQTIGGR
jgi:hypothetical protein